MNGRSGPPQGQQQQGQGQNPQQLHSQVGFYLLPPDQGGPSGSKSKKKVNRRTRNERRWASQNQLDAIAEASDESRNSSPNRDIFDDVRRGPAWNSSPARLIRDHTASRGLIGGQPIAGIDVPPRGMSNCRHPQARMCDNLKYNLHQLKMRGQRDAYMSIVDAVVVGPEVVRTSEAEDILGISNDLVLRCRARRKMDTDGIEDLPEDDVSLDYEPLAYDNGAGKRNKRQQQMNQLWQQRPPGLRDLFAMYARFGDTHSNGQHITLTQSDKWLKQAGVVDNWNITTTDTAIYYRKISRGSKWLDYESWKVFLEELSYRKRVSVDIIHEKLMAAGKPGLNQMTSYSRETNMDRDFRRPYNEF